MSKIVFKTLLYVFHLFYVLKYSLIIRNLNLSFKNYGNLFKLQMADRIVIYTIEPDTVKVKYIFNRKKISLSES